MEAIRNGGATRVILAKGLGQGTVKELEKLAKRQDILVEHVPRIEMDKALRSTKHQGIAAELPKLDFSEPDAPFRLAKARGEEPFLVLLDQITDTHNYGAIIRSAEVLGAHGVISEERRSAPLSPIVVKTSAGAANHLPLVQVKNLPRYMDEIKKEGIWIYGSAGNASQTAAQLDWQRPVAVVIGSEGEGMRRLVREKCDALLHIPMRGKVTSLNASVAAGIILHSAINQRTNAQP